MGTPISLVFQVCNNLTPFFISKLPNLSCFKFSCFLEFSFPLESISLWIRIRIDLPLLDPDSDSYLLHKNILYAGYSIGNAEPDPGERKFTNIYK
jgi:hypothetical protein